MTILTIHRPTLTIAPILKAFVDAVWTVIVFNVVSNAIIDLMILR